MDPRELLRRLLDASGLNPNSLAAATRGRTKQPQIHRFLTGVAKEPKRSTWEPVASYFHVPVDAFFDSQAADAAWLEYAGRSEPAAAAPARATVVRERDPLSVGDALNVVLSALRQLPRDARANLAADWAALLSAPDSNELRNAIAQELSEPRRDGVTERRSGRDRRASDTPPKGE